jgi:hypothetical protein
MPRSFFALPLALSLAAALSVLGCGDSRKPTPTSPEPVAVSLLGHWSGSMRVDRTDGTRESCTLSTDFNRESQGTFGGTYSVACADGRHQEGLVGAAAVGDYVFDGLQAVATGNPAPALDGCDWEGHLVPLGTRLTGPWAAGGPCAGSPILGGLIDLSKS